jgi:hypothetical protein
MYGEGKYQIEMRIECKTIEELGKGSKTNVVRKLSQAPLVLPMAGILGQTTLSLSSQATLSSVAQC